MIVTNTGIAFSLSSLGLIFCSFWFSKAFREIGGLRSGSLISFLLSIFFLGLAFEHAILAAAGLFFSTMPDATYALLTVANLILAIVATLGTYLAFYILLPKFSPWPAVLATLVLGLFVVAMTIVTHPHPFIDSDNSLNWNMSRAVELPLYYLLIISLASPFLIFAKSFFQATKNNVKVISLVIMLTHFLGLINVSILFSGLFEHNVGSQTHIFDKILASIGILFVVGFLIVPWVKGWFRSSIEKANITSNKK